MELINSPGDVIAELATIRAQAGQGGQYLAEVEAKLIEAELAYDRAKALALLTIDEADKARKVTIPVREAQVEIATQEERRHVGLARIEVGRVKLKLKHLSEAMMAVQTSARMIELEWKTAGIGER